MGFPLHYAPFPSPQEPAAALKRNDGQGQSSWVPLGALRPGKEP